MALDRFVWEESSHPHPDPPRRPRDSASGGCPAARSGSSPARSGRRSSPPSRSAPSRSPAAATIVRSRACWQRTRRSGSPMSVFESRLSNLQGSSPNPRTATRKLAHRRRSRATSERSASREPADRSAAPPPRRRSRARGAHGSARRSRSGRSKCGSDENLRRDLRHPLDLAGRRTAHERLRLAPRPDHRPARVPLRRRHLGPARQARSPPRPRAWWR